MSCLRQVISDLADPSEGVYSSASAMEERLEATDRMLECVPCSLCLCVSTSHALGPPPQCSGWMRLQWIQMPRLTPRDAALLCRRHQSLPIIPEAGTGLANAETNAYLNRRPAGVAVTKEDVDGKGVGVIKC